MLKIYKFITKSSFTIKMYKNNWMESLFIETTMLCDTMNRNNQAL